MKFMFPLYFPDDTGEPSPEAEALSDVDILEEADKNKKRPKALKPRITIGKATNPKKNLRKQKTTRTH